LPNIVGIKDATGDMTRATVQRTTCGDDWIMLSGDDPTALGYMAHGGHGCISVTANVVPDQCAAFYNAALNGDAKGALYWQDRLVRLHKAMFTDSSPAPAKYALSQLGLCDEAVRLPLVQASEASRAEVKAALQEAGVL
jgi:4-hydroxy-tetrahydrodipicolinate synthase